MFDVHSHLARKNPLAVIEAFSTRVSPSEPVRLILKCVNAESDPTGFATLLDRASGAAIDIHSGYISTDAIRSLMSSCDAYVSLHRSEGIGLTIADAMGLGKPVIATGWSGNTDFMDVSNAFPVGYSSSRSRERRPLPRR
jgi:glycosyltransferase involved in cell wall biosynthesis